MPSTTHNAPMRLPLVVSGLLLASVAAAQTRTPTEGSGAGYSTVGARPRVSVAGDAGAGAAPVVVTSAAPSGPRGPESEGATVTITNTAARAPSRPATPARNAIVAGDTTYVTGPDGNVVAVRREAAPPASADAGVDDPNLPTTGALYGGPLPGPSIAYMGVPVNTRRPPPAPPLAPGAVLPGHSLPGSTPAPPPGTAPWVPWSTSGFQLGPSGTSTDTSGYGFQTQPPTNPGTLRGTTR